MRLESSKQSVATLAVVVWLLALKTAGAQTTTQVKTFEIIEVDGNVLVVREADGTKEITVPPDFRFTVNGKKLAVGDLKAGMKGTATIITTTTTVRPVFVQVVKNAEVVKTLGGGSIVVRGAQGLKMYTQGEVDKRGIRVYKDGRRIDLSELRAGDKLTATLVTEGPPQVVTEKQVEATLAATPAAAAAAPVAPAATAVAPAATVAEPVAEPAANAEAAPATAAAGEPAPAPATGEGGRSWFRWVLLALVVVIVLFFVFRRSRA